MPLVTVTLRKGKSKEYKQMLLESIHQALVDVFKIPEDDHMHRILELDSENMQTVSTMGPDAVFVEMTVFPGRSPAAKKQLYQEIVRHLEKSPGIKPIDIIITLFEPPKENWGIRGGQIATEVDLGFKLDV